MDLDGSFRSEKSVYMRLALEKLISSRALSYMRDDEIKKARCAFVSLNPSDQAHTFFFELKGSQPGRSKTVVANMTFSWQVVKEKEVMPDGSLWSTYGFSHSFTVREMYSLQGPVLLEWLSCVAAIDELVKDVSSLNIPRDIREMTHSPDERAALEKEELRANIKQSLSNFFSTSGKNFVYNLRVGGRARHVPLSQISHLISERFEETHEFKVNAARSFYSWRAKHYELEAFSDKDYAVVRRIA